MFKDKYLFLYELLGEVKSTDYIASSGTADDTEHSGAIYYNFLVNRACLMAGSIVIDEVGS